MQKWEYLSYSMTFKHARLGCSLAYAKELRRSLQAIYKHPEKIVLKGAQPQDEEDDPNRWISIVLKDAGDGD